ncbi:hypothetical protein KUV65_04055 [Maritalea mobilis]|uniref:DUF6538 domain-containing protein n=1 Tax=Maritalea mobilis TaxID=483324 RepID=UPI001C957FD5|nr:DUF6538 domain-containing protein [Maritalea mobilis]MBY6200523.1 hypothetical protein [Maritalea mobilis]
MPRNRRLPPHLETRRTGYYWRRRLPRSLRGCGETVDDSSGKKPCPASKKMFLCFSLRTHVPADAKTLARRLTEMSDLVFAAGAETTMAIAADIQATLLETLARFEIEAFERARAAAGWRSPEVAAMDLQREEALQATLRQALYLGDREVAQRPLRHVAERLGVKLDEADEDWPALAYEATKVLLDVSQERTRRQQGHYDQPTVFFRRAIHTADPASVPHRVMAAPPMYTPAAFATEQAPAAQAAPAPTMFETETCGAPPVAHPAAPQPRVSPSQHATPSRPAPSVGAPVPRPTTSAARVVVPAGLDRPEGYDDARWQEARVAARPPRILVDRTLLSEASRAALDKPRGITTSEAIELYFELLSWGYRPPFDNHQKRRKVSDDLKNAMLEDRLGQNYLGKYRLAKDFWPAIFGDDPVDEIAVDDVNDGLERFWGVPAHHGRSEKDRGKYSLIELIEKADAKDAQLERDIETAVARGASAEEIDKLRLARHTPRISITTYINHGRVLGNVGRMLMDMQLVDQNPFAVCNWTNQDVRELKSTEGGRKRQAWDDRINALWNSRIYQEPLKDIGEPLFWAPLIARHQGMRMEEILQLGPDDFGTDNGIPYLSIRHTIINGVKTLSSARTLPIHPHLIDLGLLKLVALRREKGHIRLFPSITRGKQKGTFSANFTKKFQYYRKTNDCYWPGLDFHALRTTFHHDLLGDDKSDAIRCRLMGHTYTDEGDRSYGQNLGIKTLAERMKSVDVDISMIRRPFDTPGAVVNARAKEHGLRVVG